MNEERKELIPEQAPEQVSEEERKKDLKKKLAKTGVALFTSASVLVGGVFPSPDALLADEQPLNPVVAYENDNDDLDGDGGDDDGSADEEEEEELAGETAGVRARLKQRILQLPLALRVFVLVPMWALGWGIWTVATGLWSMLLGPIAGKALGWLFLLAALLGAFTLGIKAIFPDMPLKKILNKKSLLGLLLGGLALGAADLTLPLFWDGYEHLAQIFRASGVAVILGTVSFALIRRTLRRRREEAAAAEEAPAEPEAEEAPRPWTDAEILALTDSVSRKR
jgi:hypothetical protein